MSDDWARILEPGERVIWQGRPDPGLRFDGFAPGTTVFGLAVAGFALFFTWQGLGAVASGPLGILFPVAGIAFLGVGLNLAGGRFFLDAWMRRHTTYSLTNRRAFIATEAFGRRRLRAFPIDASTVVDLVDGPLQSVGFRGARTALSAPRASFDGLADGQAVLALMERVKAGTA